jgi:hypothetical protein
VYEQAPREAEHDSKQQNERDEFFESRKTAPPFDTAEQLAKKLSRQRKKQRRVERTAPPSPLDFRLENNEFSTAEHSSSTNISRRIKLIVAISL